MTFKRIAASGPGLQCLPMSFLWYTRLKWVKGPKRPHADSEYCDQTAAAQAQLCFPWIHIAKTNYGLECEGTCMFYNTHGCHFGVAKYMYLCVQCINVYKLWILHCLTLRFIVYD